MANQVFANNMEISCKAANGKGICAFPDVCFTPPLTPATPPGVPIPYPNTGMASDCADGSTSVKISGKEIMLKNKSYFKKSTGDEAGSAPKKGVVTSKITGKIYFTVWSMDVKVEGENVVRNLDLATHNHASMPGNSPPWVYTDTVGMTVGVTDDPCKKTRETAKTFCEEGYKKSIRASGKRKGTVNMAGAKREMCKNPCKDAMKCVLAPFAYGCCKDEDGVEKTPHHLVEVHCFTEIGGRDDGKVMSEFTGYDAAKAPCVCASGPRHDKEHGACHAIQGQFEAAYNNHFNARNTRMSSGVSNWNYGEARRAGVTAMMLVFPDCDHECTEAQLDKYHKAKNPDGPGVADAAPVRSDLVNRSSGELTSRQQSQLNSSILVSMIRSGF